MVSRERELHAFYESCKRIPNKVLPNRSSAAHDSPRARFDWPLPKDLHLGTVLPRVPAGSQPLGFKGRNR